MAASLNLPHHCSQDEISSVWGSTPHFTLGKLVFFIVSRPQSVVRFILHIEFLFKNRYLPPATFLAHIVVGIRDSLSNRVSLLHASQNHSVAHYYEAGSSRNVSIRVIFLLVL